MERHPHPDSFVRRHNGPSEADIASMVKGLGVPTLDALIDETVPKGIRGLRARDAR
jgi:glycine dehydrogenase